MFLVVDDSSAVREAVAERLASAFPSCSVRTVGSGEKAVKMVEEECIAAVVMDITLPGISGIEASQRIRAASPDVAIVMLSIHEEEEYIRDAMSAGASAYVVKREIGRKLVAALQDALSKTRNAPTGSVDADGAGME
ncbi:MAG: response regulator transcription factor [Candidatus Bipolaricaulis sp.]|nr:response regulator transcription factor [Candidatus Bipolaricaulis sp.]